MTTRITILFVNKTNKSEYKEKVLSWLKADYNALGQPQTHFWHNRKMINMAFDAGNAMVALNKEGEVIGYMVYRIVGIRAEIDIIEVRKDYRRQGVFKKMLSTFSESIININVLTASVLPQAEKAFARVGWIVQHDCQHRKRHMKVVRPGVKPLSKLPNGRVIAVCSSMDPYCDFHMVAKEPEQYKSLMRYFRVDVNQNGKLLEPIITACHKDAYIGVFFNEQLVVEGKARHLFSNDSEICNATLLVMDKIKPLQPEFFHKVAFFPKPQMQQGPGLFLSASREAEKNQTTGEKRSRVDMQDMREEDSSLDADQRCTKKRKSDDVNTFPLPFGQC